jgi:MFS family permease
MAFQPSDTLKSRTYLGLILAQFLAAFNDQAIHASAMFYAIHQGILTEAQAITLMPMLFYAPWALFSTLAGFLADRYSKRNSLVFWKIAEILITLITLGGFWLGSVRHNFFGPWIVLSTVFLMGTHSAFFVPAKYGVMPEILQPFLLSKGNGVLESTSFLAVILGTVSGGVLSDERVFKGQEYYIGAILVVLALIGALASWLIQLMPAANPTRPFRINLFKPLVDNLRIMLRSRPLALAVLGIAFFTFMVAFMRCTMYMHGETRNPRWNELHTSMVVATVALGVGLGSPLAGSLSGGKVELGLVPLGAVGMITATILAAATIFWEPGLLSALVLIGFCSGFYIVPLYTLLQHRAPTTSKGDLIATSNFINVTGATAASLLFFGLVDVAHRVGIAPEVPQQDYFAHGELQELKYKNGRPVSFVVPKTPGSGILVEIPPSVPDYSDTPEDDEDKGDQVRIDQGDYGDSWIELHNDLQGAQPGNSGSLVIVSRYTLIQEGKKVEHYKIRLEDQPLIPAYNNQKLPRYLFLGASTMTLGILILLCRRLPDFFVRTLLWLRSHGRYRIKVVGLNNLPSNGGVILATNCDRFQSSMHVLAATDRLARFVLLESTADDEPRRPLLRYMARRTGLVILRPGITNADNWEQALVKASTTLASGDLLGLTVASSEWTQEAERFFQDLAARQTATLLPVFCDPIDTSSTPNGDVRSLRRVRVVIGHPLPPAASIDNVRQAIQAIADWIKRVDRGSAVLATVMIPGASTASPTGPAADRPARP